MKINCVWEHNGDDTLLYAVEQVGAFARGESVDVAMSKMKEEIISYFRWKEMAEVGETVPEMMVAPAMTWDTTYELEIVQEKESDLQIADADSDVIFEDEKRELTLEEYRQLKKLVLKSAKDFYDMYESITDKDKSCLPERKTFYGAIPRTAKEMYEHTKNVNAYYFGEVGVEADNEGNIYECRKRGFELLEKTEDYLKNPVIEGSYDELWSVRKMMRRFLWHDRIHGKAMWRMAVKTFGKDAVKDTFRFAER